MNRFERYRWCPSRARGTELQTLFFDMLCHNGLMNLEYVDTILSEMAKGNFSFPILVVGILQIVITMRK